MRFGRAVYTVDPEMRIQHLIFSLPNSLHLWPKPHNTNSAIRHYPARAMTFESKKKQSEWYELILDTSYKSAKEEASLSPTSRGAHEIL
eukprot:921606-Rhodomonas_salina.2